jgi:hypothetical protein
VEDGGIRDSKWRQKLNEQSKQIAFALLGKQLAELDRYSRSLQMPITTRRWGWLESKPVDHGGNPKQLGPGHVPGKTGWNSSTYRPTPIYYDADARGWLSEHGMKSDNTKRKGEGRKTEPTGLQEDTTGNDPIESFTPRQRYERHHIEPETEADYKFLKRWAATTGRKPFWKPARDLERKGHHFPKFTRASLSEAGRARRDLEISLDLIGARSERLMERLWNSQVAAADEINDSSVSSHFSGRSSDAGWARAIGVKRASDLERVKQSRIEDAIHTHLDLWKASGARRSQRGYHAPVELKVAAAYYVWDWELAELEALADLEILGGLGLSFRLTDHVNELRHRLKDYQPRGWEPIYGLRKRLGRRGVAFGLPLKAEPRADTAETTMLLCRAVESRASRWEGASTPGSHFQGGRYA